MARLFDGDEEYGQSSTTIDLSGVNKLTVVFWLYSDQYFAGTDVALEFTANYNSNAGGFVFTSDRADGGAQVGLSGNVDLCRTVFTRPTVATWHHWAALLDKSKSSQEVDKVYIDGSSQSLTYEVDGNNSDNFANSTLYVMSRGGSSLFTFGRMCELAIYPGVLLDAAEINALVKGVSPMLVRPTAAPYYWPMYGHPHTNTAPATEHEPELFHGVTMDLTGDATHQPPPDTPGPSLIYAVSPYVIGARAVVTETISPAGTLTTAGAVAKAVAPARYTGTLTTAGATAPAPGARTRLYFSSATGAAAAPAYDAGWNYTTEASRWRLKHTKGTSAMTDGTQIGAWANTAGTKALDRQYVSNPLDGAQNVGGSIKGQLLVQESANTDNVDQIICVIKVVSIDGGTVRGTLLSLGSRGPTGEFRFSGYRNKFIADGDAATLVAAQNGDRIVVEIGYSNSTAGTTPEATARWGENATDLPENETQTTDGAGWIEFGSTNTFQADAAGGLDATGTVTPAGNVIKLVGKII